MWPATTAFHPTLVLLVFLQLLRLAAPRQDPPQDPYVLPCCGDIQGGDVCAVVDIVEYGKVTERPDLCLQRTDGKRNGNRCPDQNCRALLNKYEGFKILGPGKW
ncbi:hypothetical protein JOL62DRAFT_553598 [Phyllosticta paracitricarpa]|uniref:Uncharacterized protein n=1 Tax=Phyllosticta paracitricarpa TaxID=2016321 RepID=A0ABR1NI03_9PEZI